MATSSSKDMSGIEYWFSLFSYIVQTLSFSALILFGVLCLIASNIFSGLINRINVLNKVSFPSSSAVIQELKPTRNSHSQVVDGQDFINLTKLYLLLCDFIEQLSNSFRWILLIGTVYTFVGFIHSSFIVISNLKSFTWIWHAVLLLIHHSAATLVLFMIPHRISIKVYN